jgi:glutaminyl-tRNA synthetase
MGDFNPGSLEALTDARVEPALVDAAPGEAVQFERQGYFCLDRDTSPRRLVFNRTVGLRDSWARAQTATR